MKPILPRRPEAVVSNSSPDPGPPPVHGLDWLAEHLRMPLNRNGYALLFGAGITSSLGLAYWVLAARLYPAEVVGLNSALLSAMMLLSGMGQLGVDAALIRFIPRAGPATRRLVLVAYGVAVGAAALASIIFYAGANWWAPALGFVSGSTLWKLSFGAAVIAWCLFSLQDKVLTGLRQAIWVPVANTVFTLVKIVLLAVFAGTFRAFGILLSWVLPAMLLVPAVNALIFARLIPWRPRPAAELQQRPALPQILRFGAGNFFGSLFFVLSSTLLPVIVTNQVGASANAYFYLPWTISGALQLIGLSLATSLVVEGALDRSKLVAFSYQILVNSFSLLVPIGLLIWISAPYLLQIFGPAYSVAGTALLRLLVLATMPSTIVAVGIGLMRVQNRNTQIVVAQGALCLAALGLSFALLPRWGITGVGLAWLISQTVVALYLVVTELWPLYRRGTVAPAESRVGSFI